MTNNSEETESIISSGSSKSKESTEPQLEGVADITGERATEAFSILGNRTRLAILLALWDAYDPHADRNVMSFTELREGVGISDPGNFNYHLNKLEGQYIRKVQGGYELRRTGLMLVQSIIAGIGIEEPTFELTRIDAPCPFCGSPTAITYDNVYMYQVCTECKGTDPGDEHPEGTLIAWTFEPTGLSNRTAEEVFTASTIKNFGRIAMRFEGMCPDCSGPVEWSLDICEDHEPAPDGLCPNCGREEEILAQETCTVCKSSGYGSPSIKILFHPAVIAFYYNHGIEIGFTGNTGFSDIVRTLSLLEEFEEEVVSTDPLRIRVTIRYESDKLALTLNEEMNVVDVTR